MAEGFVEQGARWIHVVDLDRAFGAGDNEAAIRRLADRLATTVHLQLGGGMRNVPVIRTALDFGISRVVIGTAAAVDSSFLSEAVPALGAEYLAVAIDARDGWVALRGWTETSNQRAEALARLAVQAGIDTVVYTDISRDGMLSGPDLDGAVALQSTGAHVIVSGGVASYHDIRAACQAGLCGAIVGKALYEGRLTLSEAIQAAEC
jgi:phosphoribosylformimino-5-aminoimidazole carboxamide ribotide isomerase